MERVFRSKEVWAAGVALLVAVAAVFGFELDGEALLAALAVLAGAAGALGGALTRGPAVEAGVAPRNFLDQWAEAGGQVHVQALEEPFIYPDAEDDTPVHVTEVVVELSEQMAVMRERVEQLEQAVFAAKG